MEFLRLFNNTSDYEVFKEGDEFITPNVSLILGNSLVNYSPRITLGEKAFKTVYNTSLFNMMPFNTSFLMKELMINEEKTEIKNDVEGDKTINCIQEIEEKIIKIPSFKIKGEYMGDIITCNMPNKYFADIKSYSIKIIDNIDITDKYLMLLLSIEGINAGEDFNAIGIHLPVSVLISDGYITYDEANNILIASIDFINEIKSVYPLPMCAVLCDKENSNTFNVYNTENCYYANKMSISTISTFSFARIPQEYWVYEPTYYYLKPVDNSVNPTDKYIILFTNEHAFIHNINKDEIIYNSETNEVDLMNYYNRCFFINKIMFLEEDNPLMWFALCDVEINDSNAIIKNIYDTIIRTDGKTNSTLSYTFEKSGKNKIEFIMKDETKCPSFNNKGLSEITIPDGITTIENYTFNGCGGLKSIKIPDTVTSIGECAFKDTSIEEFIMSDNVIDIGGGLFYGCSNLKTVVLSKHITSLEDGNGEPWGFFGECSLLEHITIPKNVTYIGPHCFRGCSSLSSIRCEAIEAPSLYDYDTFYNIPPTGTLYYPAGSDYSTWIAALPGWTYVEF